MLYPFLSKDLRWKFRPEVNKEQQITCGLWIFAIVNITRVSRNDQLNRRNQKLSHLAFVSIMIASSLEVEKKILEINSKIVAIQLFFFFFFCVCQNLSSNNEKTLLSVLKLNSGLVWSGLAVLSCSLVPNLWIAFSVGWTGQMGLEIK